MPCTAFGCLWGNSLCVFTRENFLDNLILSKQMDPVETQSLLNELRVDR